MAGGAIAACDQGKQHDQQTVGPPVHIVGANVGPQRALPADGKIQIAFDRLLLPSTVIRQSFILADANNNALEPIVTYDPITRVVTLSNPNAAGGAWLTVGLSYKVVFEVAKTGDDQSGVRAIDRATLDPASAGELGFPVSAATGVIGTDPAVKFCTDVLPIFSARCATSGACHQSPGTIPDATWLKSPALQEQFPDKQSRPAAGLILDSSGGIAGTSIGRVAQGSNTGARAGIAEPPGALFGVDMPIVDPGNPSNSWLMYKLLLAPEQPAADETNGPLTNATCATKTPTLQPPPQVTPAPSAISDDERTRLSDYVLGNQMPYPPNPGSSATDISNLTQDLTHDELERVRAWIAQGAPVIDCSVCP